MNINDILLHKSEKRTFDDQLIDHRKKIIDTAATSTAVNDAYGNSILSVGKDDIVSKYDTFSLDNTTLNWQLWLTLYTDSWVFRRAIDKPAEDEIYCGINITGIPDEYKKLIYSELQLLNLPLQDLLKWGALFGGSVACIMTNAVTDIEQYSKPIDNHLFCDGNTKISLYVTDRWYGCQPSAKCVTDFYDDDYGTPEFYNITVANSTTVRFHHSWIIRYNHTSAPQFLKRGMLNGWGLAEGVHIFNELSRDEKLRASIQSLINKSLIEVVQMDGMRGLFMGADTETQKQLEKRLEMVNWARDYNSLTFLDTNDKYTMNSFSGLSGLADLLKENRFNIAAALNMQGVLYGDLRQGFAPDTNALLRYSETIKTRCETYLRKPLTKLIKTICLINNINSTNLTFQFKQIFKNDTNQATLQSLQSLINVCQSLLSNQIISTEQFKNTIKHYLETSDISFDFDNYINNAEFNKTNSDSNSTLETNTNIPMSRSGSMPVNHTPRSNLTSTIQTSNFSAQSPQNIETNNTNFNNNSEEY